jgi:hypothetical protein
MSSDVGKWFRVTQSNLFGSENIYPEYVNVGDILICEEENEDYEYLLKHYKSGNKFIKSVILVQLSIDELTKHEIRKLKIKDLL